ncbi:MAG: type II/IV secretion system protein [Lentisphaerae bacterium]|nr:type II/IV secretion system protein [Lentisphaerota bacterium]
MQASPHPLPPREADDPARGLAERFGLAYLARVDDGMLQPDLLAALPLSWARSQCVVPLEIEGEACLLVADPTRVEVHQQAAQVVGRPLRCVVAAGVVVQEAIERGYAAHAKADAGGYIRSLDAAAGAAPPGGREAVLSRVSDLLEAAEAAPVTRLVNLILLEAVKQHASDIHFEPFEDRLAVRYRIDGVLYSRAEPPKHLEAALVSRLKVMSRLDIAERRLPQDGMAQVRVGERALDIRVSTVPVADGERVVLRLLNREDACLPLTALGMDDSLLDGFQRLLRMPNGMIVVSGPTGSGKTTTLYAALGGIDARRRNVMTIEDPIEYRLNGIGQIQVKPKIGLTFASGLRHILRQDPDVVLVGETRDAETAEIAVRASLTGHLVFTTLHTNDAPAAVMRLMDMGIQSYLLAACLRGVLGQRLVRTLCPHCRRPATWEEAVRACDVPAEWHGRVACADWWQAAGCDRCLEGYGGRKGLFELMLCDAPVRAAIRQGGAAAADLRAVALAAGMRPLLDDGLAKAARGVTDLREVAGALSV